MGTMTQYQITPAFRSWLARFRPEALAALDATGTVAGVLCHGGGPRSRLRFPTLGLGPWPGFDPVPDTSEACLVLDGHPDHLAAETVRIDHPNGKAYAKLLAIAEVCGPYNGHGGIQLPPTKAAIALETIRRIVTLATGYEFVTLC